MSAKNISVRKSGRGHQVYDTSANNSTSVVNQKAKKYPIANKEVKVGRGKNNSVNMPVSSAALKSELNSSSKPISAPENVLLLGMVYSKRALNPSRGQEFRDRVRCEALSELGYDVKTLDDKHEDESDENLHCQTNFSDPRRMISSMNNLWENCKFDHIILDYFFSPVGWARTRWSERFYKETLPALARNHMFKPSGKIWLPRIQCVEECILEYSSIIEDHFVIDMIEDPCENPLFKATSKVRDALEECPDKLSNDNQILPLLEYSKKPFFCLTFYNAIPSEPLSPTKRKHTAINISNENLTKKQNKASISAESEGRSLRTRNKHIDTSINTQKPTVESSGYTSKRRKL